MDVRQPGALEPPRLRLATLEDYSKIKMLALAHSADIPSEEDWGRLWIDNPLRVRFADDAPLGWVLEIRNGEVVGTMGTVRTAYTFRGNKLISAAGRFWFVATPYRGLALQLMDQYFGQPVDLFINNTVAKDAHASFSQLSSPIPLGQWDCMPYWLISELIDRATLKRTPEKTQRQVRSKVFEIETVDRFDPNFDVFWEELVKQNPEVLLAERTSETLTWHFGAPMRRAQLWIITACRNNILRAYCMLTRQHHAFRLPAVPHGDPNGMSALRFVDFQTIEPELNLLGPLLEAALARCMKEDVAVFESFGRGVPKMRAIDDIAPHVEHLTNWKGYYAAAGPSLDAELREARYWDPSAFDGDASFE